MERLEYAWKFDHPADAVWKIVGDFGSAEIGKGFVDRVEIKGSGVGMLRIFHLPDYLGGGSITERLDAHDPQARNYDYSIVDYGPLPFAAYSGRMTVSPCGPKACFLVVVIELMPVTAPAYECRAISVNNMRHFHQNILRLLKA